MKKIDITGELRQIDAEGSDVLCVTFLNLAMKVVSNEGRGNFHDFNIFQSFRVCHGVEMANQPAFLRGGLHCVQHP